MPKTQDIVLATGNAHKAQEFQALADALALPFAFAQASSSPANIEETGATYLENAKIKARAFFDHLKQPVLADDSGLEIDVLGGEPGVHSARYSGPDATSATNIDRVLRELAAKGAEVSSGRFVCVLVYLDENIEVTAQGILEGDVLTTLQGANGFGYDPLFRPTGQSATLAELSGQAKNAISHRGQALTEMAEKLRLIRA